MKYFLRVLPYLYPYWKLAIGSGLLIIVATLVGLLGPWPMAFLLDNVIEHKALPPILDTVLQPIMGFKFALLLCAVGAGLLLAIIENGLGVLDNYVNTKLELNMSMDLRSDLFNHAQRLSLAHHDQKRSGMLIYAINGQADAGARLMMSIPAMAHSVLTLAGMLYILLMLDWQLALLSLVVVPFLIFSVRYYVTHIQESIYHVRRMEGESLSIIHEAMSMIRVIMAFGREDHEHRRYRTQAKSAVDARVKVTVRQSLFTLCVDSITAAGTAVVLGVGAYHIIQGRLSIGQLYVALAYLHGVYKPLESISSTIGSMQEMFMSLRVAFELKDTEPEIHNRPGAKDLPVVRGHIVYDRVGFHYSGREGTLTEVSFQMAPGQVIGLVGPTGAGKTTLVSLLPRFYDVKGGRILIDGHDIRDLTLESLRRQISIVLQEPLLFSGTIADNIRYGRLEASMDEIVEAAQAANAHDFISKLPEQYDTELGERGAMLSGGERQRIAIARAFLKNAPILILDEPTSSIDSKTEAVILDALDRLMAGRSTFMVAHRLSTMRHVDRLLVLNQGSLVEQGTHEELMRRGGLYQQMYEMQSRPLGRRRAAELDETTEEDGEAA